MKLFEVFEMWKRGVKMLDNHPGVAYAIGFPLLVGLIILSGWVSSIFSLGWAILISLGGGTVLILSLPFFAVLWYFLRYR